ncbi:Ycf51 family protein [Spirulina subsalsa]|uniref:Ycf51 family protein n=1 Tax=Spirulina subsalsa TaxID=54311 RepID=UPI0003161042|nr:Ycf51 family protein [Spirulina subsalsa]
MQLPTDFAVYIQGCAIATGLFFLLTLLAFALKWGFRFRLVGITSFMVVLTIGVFGLSLGLFQRVAIPGAVRYTLVFDNAANNVVVTIPATVTEDELTATLQQAAIDISPFGRLGGDNSQVSIRARALIHPEPGISVPLYLGQATKRVADREQEAVQVYIFSENLQKIADLNT